MAKWVRSFSLGGLAAIKIVLRIAERSIAWNRAKAEMRTGGKAESSQANAAHARLPEEFRGRAKPHAAGVSVFQYFSISAFQHLPG
jgi:hypothetical protein